MATKKLKKEPAVVDMLRRQKKGTEYYIFPVKTFGTIIGTMADGVLAPPPKVHIVFPPPTSPPVGPAGSANVIIIPTN